MLKTDNRNLEIDGIRGWAALLVIFFHFFTEFFGRLYPELHSPILGFIFNGQLMVLIFFILSGDALSVSFFKENNPEKTVRLVAVRYVRLTFPIFVSCTMVYFLMKFNVVYNIAAAPIIHCQDWLGMFLPFQANLHDLLYYVFDGVYMHHNVATSYNPFLWTMSIEMLGSFIIFLNIFIFNYSRHKWLLLILQLCFFIVFEPYYSLFIAGMLMGGLRKNGYFQKIRTKIFNYLGLFLLIAIAVEISFFPKLEVTILTMHFDLLALLAIIIVFLIYSNDFLLGFFKNKISHFLGEISFPLYAIQFVVLVTITSYLVLYFNRLNQLDFSVACGIAFFSIFVTIIIAFVFRKFEKLFLQKVNVFIHKYIINIKG